MSDFVLEPDGSIFVTGERGGMPFTVRRDAIGEQAVAPDMDLDDLPQGWVADEPIHLSLTHAEATAAYQAMGAKEGHGTTRTGVDLPGLTPRPRRRADQVTRRPVVALLDTVVQEHEWIGDGSGEDAF